MSEGIDVVDIDDEQVLKLLAQDEGHFMDFKSIAISPTKITKTLCAFANADGGEIYIGVAQDSRSKKTIWDGFPTQEDANGLIQVCEKTFPLGQDFSYTFISNANSNGLILKVDILKTRDVKAANDEKVYVRRSAQNLPVSDDDGLRRLEKNKGISSFETEILRIDPVLITNSIKVIEFMLDVVPAAEPEQWLKKQLLLMSGHPTVAGILLFAEEPQAALPKRCGLKIYRYQTKEEGKRESLAFDPISIEGNIYDQIIDSVAKTKEIIEGVSVRTSTGIEELEYPETALHEIITNAVLHRDYSIADDIHIRIFDNRIEVASPGTLAGHVTPENILNERFSRNGVLVRLINKFPNPPNKDIGEGLNTAFDAMRDMKLKQPVISQTGGYVEVVLRHESLASPEELILEYLGKHGMIANKEAREVTYIGSENAVKRIFQAMMRSELIEMVPNRTRYNAAYQIKQ